jgi:2-phospho-L-lactate guanylyltransferase
MNWTAIVPLKAEDARKSRLAEALSSSERKALARRLFAHVSAVLEEHPQIEKTHVLAAARPEGWAGAWIVDRGRGLNAELEAARAALGARRLLVVLGDLPLLRCADLDALLEGAARRGAAIAPDRHGTGANALVLCDGAELAFCFGPDSFRRYRAQLPDAAIVEREGLALDLDTPDDLAFAKAQGFRF